jgi:heme a synthase
VAKRIPVALRDMAELHSSLALLLVGLALALAVALHAMEVPERIRKSARILVTVMVAQAAVGYSQYFTHLPVALVEIHVIGATSLVVAAVAFHLGLTRHPAEAPMVASASWAETPDTSPHRPAAEDAALSRR